MIFILQL